MKRWQKIYLYGGKIFVKRSQKTRLSRNLETGYLETDLIPRNTKHLWCSPDVQSETCLSFKISILKMLTSYPHRSTGNLCKFCDNVRYSPAGLKSRMRMHKDQIISKNVHNSFPLSYIQESLQKWSGAFESCVHKHLTQFHEVSITVYDARLLWHEIERNKNPWSRHYQRKTYDNIGVHHKNVFYHCNVLSALETWLRVHSLNDNIVVLISLIAVAYPRMMMCMFTFT